MAFQLDDTTIRLLLKDDVLAAWGSGVTFEDSPAYLPGSAEELPRVFVELEDIVPAVGQGQSGIGQASVPHVYRLTAQFAFPASGTMETAKITAFNQLAAHLTLRVRYGNVYRRLPGYPTCAFLPPAAGDAQEPIFTLVIRFGVEVVTDK